MKRLNEFLIKHHILIGAWAGIATIISIFLGIQLSITNNNITNNNDYRIDGPTDDNIIVQGENDINLDNSTNTNTNINGNDNVVNSKLYYNILEDPSKYSEVEVLKQAEFLYDSEEYKAVFNLYSLDQVSNNEIALSNLGYMYAKGLGVQQNTDKAIKKYNAAIRQGSYIARKNKIILLFNNIFVTDKNDDFDAKYIKEIIKEANELSNMHVNDDFSSYFNTELSFLNALKNTDDFFRRYYYWGKPQIVRLYTIPSNDFYTKYEDMHESQHATAELNYSSYWTAKKIKRENKINDLFKETWIEVPN